MDEHLIRNEIQYLLLQMCILEDKYHDAVKNDDFLETKKKIRLDIKSIQNKLKDLEIMLNTSERSSKAG